MLDKCTEMLMRRYEPSNPLLEWANLPRAEEPEQVVLQKTNITLEELLLKVRSDMLSSWGLNPEDRHSFADDIVALATVQKCREYNVTNMPEGGPK